VRTVVDRFALYAAALRMAIEADLLPWSIKEADAGIVSCMDRWAAQRGNVDTAGEIVRAARRIEAELAAKLSGRFIHIDKIDGKWAPISEADQIKQQTPQEFDGYAKPDRILVRPEAWRRYCDGFDPVEIARHLRDRGALIAGRNDLTKSEQVFGKISRFYVLSRSALTGLTA
jgi:hypothetical protein